MATFVQTNVGLYWGGYSLASTFNAIALSTAAAAVDDTVYGDTTVSHAAGLSTVSLEGEGYWSPTEDAALFSGISINASDTVVTVTPYNQSAGSRAIFSNLAVSEYSPVSGTVGDMAGFKLSGESRGDKAVSGEILVAAGSDRTSSSTSAVNASIGAVSATQKIYSALHVISASGTIDVTVKSAALVGFGSPTTRITHTQFGAIGAELKSASGAITDAFWRVDFTISGGGSFDFIVSLAVK